MSNADRTQLYLDLFSMALAGVNAGVVARDKYNAAHEKAVELGDVTDEQLDENTARFTHIAADPAAIEIPPPPPPPIVIGDPLPPDPPGAVAYYRILDFVPTDDQLNGGDEVFLNEAKTQAVIMVHGAIGSVPEGFTHDHTVQKV
jgi:hypothetical protein